MCPWAITEKSKKEIRVILSPVINSVAERLSKKEKRTKANILMIAMRRGFIVGKPDFFTQEKNSKL